MFKLVERGDIDSTNCFVVNEHIRGRESRRDNTGYIIGKDDLVPRAMIFLFNVPYTELDDINNGNETSMTYEFRAICGKQLEKFSAAAQHCEDHLEDGDFRFPLAGGEYFLRIDIPLRFSESNKHSPLGHIEY